MIQWILQVYSWLSDHQIAMTVTALLSVPWYVHENMRRKGNCKFQLWFMFAVNVIGVVAGLYVFVPTLIGAFLPHPITDQKTFMAAFGSGCIIILTSKNIYDELNTLFMKDVQPKRRTRQSS
ncbi:MAG: hypothetical protein ABSF45_09035 [Terriglobia bacterium]|jgi:hypothetical protein